MSLGPDWLKQDEVVAMHDLTFERRSELTGQVVRGTAQQRRQLGGVVVDQASGDGVTGWVAQVNGIAVAEPTLDLEDPRRKQRLASLNDGRHRSVVQDQPATGSGGMGQPEQPAGPAGPGRHEQGCLLYTSPSPRDGLL